MFAAVCKENFRKFDVNGDGVLSWTEVLPLVSTLYESFGLQPPREGNLRSFFDATDLNKDGVLSEKEFKKFFECFLRYAFFDVVLKEKAPNLSEDVKPDNPEPERQDKAPRGPSPKRASGSPKGRSFRVIAPHGISWRKSPDFNDRADANVPAGEVVTVLEQWVKTDRGWLPVHDARGKLLLQPEEEPRAAGPAHSAARREKRPKEEKVSVPEVASSGGTELRSGEEEWKERFERLKERFPMLSSAQVLQKLRAHQGHAGHTAAALRELMGRQGGN
ncbi:unnamed protein product [Effrenium voratum]|nr:unnamed protein product [Effrenium voratum]